ncbi:hypothetical protein G7046_g7824 [Stylonectria norvegica]|nr:hypothetical protein G7046_g7824 [Stylonectria norvegica]
MDTIPISRLPELETHLQQLVDDPAVPFDAKLLDHIELQLNETNIPPLLPTLLPPLTTILKLTTQDPTPLLTLTIKLLSPLSFTRALTIADPESLIAALRSPLPGANLLALAILHKAAKAPSDAAILSTLPDVLEELITRWLESEDVGVGERAGKVLGDLLETDCDVVDQSANGVPEANLENGFTVVKRRVPGHARLWYLLFLNRPLLTLITSLCSPDASRNVRQTTLAQGRLLRLLPRLAALNIRAITRTPFPDLFPLPDAIVADAGQGLLQWAALGMVDKEDVLMHLNLVDFFETLVSVMRVADHSGTNDETMGRLVGTAAELDGELKAALRGLPDRTVEEEAESLRRYIDLILP